MAFHKFKDHESTLQYGSFEVFQVTAADVTNEPEAYPHGIGYYWWPCFPGCLPDSEPMGPFNTELEAYEDAIYN
jgi:hypothetical protein